MDDSVLTEALNELRNSDDVSRDTVCDRLLCDDFVPSLEEFLSMDGLNGTSVDSMVSVGDSTVGRLDLVAALVAELAKSESPRQALAKQSSNLMAKMVPGLEVESAEDPSLATAAVCCRAIGNMCHDCDVGRESVLKHGGCKAVLDLMDKLFWKTRVRDSDLQAPRSVVVGCFLNLVCDFEPAQVQALEFGAVSKLQNALQVSVKIGEIYMAVLILSGMACLTDTEKGRKTLYQEGALDVLIEVLQSTRSIELIDNIIELISSLADHEQEKLLLAQSGVCECLLMTLERVRGFPNENVPKGWTEDTKRTVARSVCDIITLVLSGEGASEVLFEDGSGPVYTAAKTWLDSREANFLISGCLAMGNFAREDASSQIVCADGVGEKLILVLRANLLNGNEQVQTAALSALKNLSISTTNRQILLRQGILSALVPLLSVESSKVAVNLLGTLRLVIQGIDDAEFASIWRDINMLKSVVRWSSSCVSRVQYEAKRLLATIAKNVFQRSSTTRPDNSMRERMLLQTMVDAGAVPPLVGLLGCEVPLMVNEALVALSVIVASLGAEAADAILEPESGTGAVDKLETVLRNGGDWSPEILVNCITFVVCLFNNGSAGSKASLLTLRQSLEALLGNPNPLVQEAVGKLLSTRF